MRARAAEALLPLESRTCPERQAKRWLAPRTTTQAHLAISRTVSSNHTALGWLEAERQRVGPAIAALDTAIRLDPRAARPLVIKGVLAARDGRFDGSVGPLAQSESAGAGLPEYRSTD